VDDGGTAAGGDFVHLGEFLPGGGEADLQALGVTGPALAACFVDAGGQVVADLGQPRVLGGVGAQQRAADAGVLVDAGSGVGAAYSAHSPSVGVRYSPAAQRPAPGDERAVGADGFFGVDG
jgi:hypothetical protein